MGDTEFQKLRSSGLGKGWDFRPHGGKDQFWSPDFWESEVVNLLQKMGDFGDSEVD